MGMTTSYNSRQLILRIQNKAPLNGTIVHPIGDDLKFSYRRRIISAHLNDRWRHDPPLFFVKGDKMDFALIQPFPEGKRLPFQLLRLQYHQGDSLIYSDQTGRISLPIERLYRQTSLAPRPTQLLPVIPHERDDVATRIDDDTLKFGDFLNMDVRNIAASMHDPGIVTIKIDSDQRLSKILLPQEGRNREQQGNETKE
jgi:hypothetical protein